MKNKRVLPKYLSYYALCIPFFLQGLTCSAPKISINEQIPPVDGEETEVTSEVMKPSTKTALKLLFSPRSHTLQLEEDNIAQERVFTITLDQKPQDDFIVYLRNLPTRESQIMVEGEHRTKTLRRVPYSGITFTPENWNIPRKIMVQLTSDNSINNGFLYNIRIPIITENTTSNTFKVYGNYQVTVVDDDQPKPITNLKGYSCDKGIVLNWSSQCSDRKICRKSSNEIAFQVFYEVNESVEAVNTTSSSIPLTEENSRLTDMVLFNENLGYNHNSLDNGTPVSYKIRLQSKNIESGDSGDSGDVEYSPLSEGITITPNAENSMVFCPSQGDGSKDSPYKISTLQHLEQMLIYPWAAFQLQNDIRLSDDFKTIDASLPFGFGGQLDGRNYSITNLRRPLFKNLLLSAKISNLHLEANINNTIQKRFCFPEHVGILTNRNSGNISKVYTTGTANFSVNTIVPSTNCGILSPFAVGGIVGTNAGEIERSYSTITIHIQGVSTNSVDGVDFGGIAGLNSHIVKNSFSTATLSTDLASLNPGNQLTGYHANVAGIAGRTGRYGVTSTVFYAVGSLPEPKITGTLGEFVDGSLIFGVIGENARANSQTTGGDWSNSEIWNLGNDSEYPCLLGLRDVANHPSDASAICN